MKEWLVTNIVAWKKMPFGVKLAFTFLATLWVIVMFKDPANGFLITSIFGVCGAIVRILNYIVEGK